MAADFPTLKSGTVASYGTERLSRFVTTVLACIDGSTFRWRERDKLAEITLVFKDIGDYDLSNIRAHWISAKGAYDATWGITLNGVRYPNCCYATDEWNFTENAGKPNRFSGQLQVLQTA